MSTITSDSASIFPHLQGTAQSSRKMVRNVQSHELSLEPEKTEEDKTPVTQPFSFKKQLTPEEERRVEFLKNTLAQILMMAEGQPTDEQKARIKEIEAELEKITGVKMQSRLSNTTSKMLGKEEEEDEELQRQLKGIDPKEAIHGKMPEKGGPPSPAMAALQQNALHTQIQAMLSKTPLTPTS